MFNLGPMELVVLAIVGIVVIGPEKLPGLARDAAGLLRTLRELATGARQQLKDELGPEFSDVDLRNLNPRTAVQKMVFGDDTDLTKFSPRGMMRDAVFGDEDLRAADPRTVLRDAKASYKASWADSGSTTPDATIDMTKPAASNGAASRPRPRPRPSAPPSGPSSSSSYGDDIT